MSAADDQAEHTGLVAGREGAQPSENPHLRGGSPGDSLFNPRLRRLWERGRLEGERKRDYKDRVQAMLRAEQEGEDPWEASARWHAADAMIHELVGRLGTASDWSAADTAELARLQGFRHGAGPLLSSYRETPTGAMISTTPSRLEQRLAIARARMMISAPAGITADEIADYYDRNHDELLAAVAESEADKPPPPLPSPRRSRKTGWAADKQEAVDYLTRTRSTALELRGGGGGGSGAPGHRREIIEDTANVRAGLRHQFIGEADRVVLIACSGPKVAGDDYHKAAELYTSPLFRAAVEYATSRKLPWAVLSAEHGLVLPSTKIRPYDHKLTRAEAPAWAKTVVSQLDRLGLLVAGTGVKAPTWEIHAGALYADPLEQLLGATATRSGANRKQLGGWRAPEDVEQPLRGLQIGQRLAWYKDQRERT